MKQTWYLCAEPAEDFPHGSERELTLVFVNGADAHFGRLFGRPHKSVNDFLFIRIEMPAVVDLNELGIHVAGVAHVGVGSRVYHAMSLVCQDSHCFLEERIHDHGPNGKGPSEDEDGQAQQPRRPPARSKPYLEPPLPRQRSLQVLQTLTKQPTPYPRSL